MAKPKRPSHISKPVYPGGLKAMRKFVSEHLSYPPTALANEVEGKVTVRYSLDYRGKVVATKIKHSLGVECDKEAMRVVSLMRFDVPQASKKKVRIHQDINIHFKLPKKKVKAAGKVPGKGATREMRITYSTPAPRTIPTEPEASAPGAGYGYTINW